jgi:hypothetical protein
MSPETVSQTDSRIRRHSCHVVRHIRLRSDGRIVALSQIRVRRDRLWTVIPVAIECTGDHEHSDIRIDGTGDVPIRRQLTEQIAFDATGA